MNPPNGTRRCRCRNFSQFLRAAAMVLLVALPASAQFDTPTHNQHNVLFLIADDLCASLGCYGANEVQSPNIDKLAASGMRFDRAYCQFSLCGPTRCSFMTGLRPDTTGILANGIPVRKHLKDVVTLPQLFRNSGYYVARVGKIYHLNIPGDVGKSGPDDPESWDYTYNPPGAEFNTDGDFADPNSKDGQSFRYVMGKGDGHEQHDFQAADKAIQLLREHKDKPFFIACGFIRPHVPEIAPKTFFDLYPLDQLKPPVVPDDDWDDIPAARAGGAARSRHDPRAVHRVDSRLSRDDLVHGRAARPGGGGAGEARPCRQHRDHIRRRPWLLPRSTSHLAEEHAVGADLPRTDADCRAGHSSSGKPLAGRNDRHLSHRCRGSAA